MLTMSMELRASDAQEGPVRDRARGHLPPKPCEPESARELHRSGTCGVRGAGAALHHDPNPKQCQTASSMADVPALAQRAISGALRKAGHTGPGVPTLPEGSDLSVKSTSEVLHESKRIKRGNYRNVEIEEAVDGEGE